MSQSEVERFARDAKADAALRAEIDKAGGIGRSLEIALKRGYAVTAEELKAGSRELSPTDLDAVAGGTNGGGRLPNQPGDDTNPHRAPS